MLRSAVQFGVERFVNISTDKAADPVNMLGQTKRLAERLTAGASSIGGGTFISVRFGNVLGSRGSVLNTFQKQIESGGPITITDPDVTRYFMTVQEAVGLVIQAGAIGSNNEVLVLDMGEQFELPTWHATSSPIPTKTCRSSTPVCVPASAFERSSLPTRRSGSSVCIRRSGMRVCWRYRSSCADELSVVDDDIARSQLTSGDAEQPVESVSL